MVIFAGVPASAEQAIIGGPFVVLEHGEKGGYEWRIYTSPMNKRQKRSLPCVNVTVERELRPISEAEVFMSCGPIKPFPTVVQVAVGLRKKKVTVAGMAFDRGVRMVKISLSGGRTVKRSPRVISTRAARKAHVKPFAFLAFAVARGLSIGRVIGYNASGQPISGMPVNGRVAM